MKVLNVDMPAVPTLSVIREDTRAKCADCNDFDE